MTAPAAANYSPAWYDRRRAGARATAEVVLPIVLDLVRPRSVIDFGCGTGTWLAVAQRLGVPRVFGIDGAHVDPAQLEIPADRFAAEDLATWDAGEGGHGLAISLEVAEHLPACAAARLVRGLCAFAPVVLFSAAVPYQPGNGHVHCRWQSYWATLFQAHDYVPIDCIRPAVWDDPRVSWWYRQNTLLFASNTAIEMSPALADALRRSRERAWPLDLVHPRHHEYGR